MDKITKSNNTGSITCEDGAVSLTKWLAVKNWELHHKYKLEDVAPRLYRYGEKRGWIGNRRNVFEVAPHRSANNSSHWKGQSPSLGAYDSNAWYHLQLVLNPGYAGERSGNFQPQDWFYTKNWQVRASTLNKYDMPA